MFFEQLKSAIKKYLIINSLIHVLRFQFKDIYGAELLYKWYESIERTGIISLVSRASNIMILNNAVYSTIYETVGCGFARPRSIIIRLQY